MSSPQLGSLSRRKSWKASEDSPQFTAVLSGSARQCALGNTSFQQGYVISLEAAKFDI